MKNIVIIFVIGLLIIAYPAIYKSSEETLTIYVKSKENVVNSESSKYLVYTENEVFQVSDSWTYLTFSSSDTYNKLDLNKKYEVTVAGWRSPFMSWYRNIVKVKSVK